MLGHLQAQVSPPETKRVTVDLRDDDKDGIYVTAEQGIFSRYIAYTAPDEDGWLRSRTANFDSSEVREGDDLTLVIETVTVPGGDLWPWDSKVETTYVFTVPAAAASGLVPMR